MEKMISFLVLLFLLLTGCTAKQAEQQNQNYQQPVKTKAQLPNSQSDSPLVETKSDEAHYARKIGQIAEKVPGVKKALVIVSGTYTLIGIDTNARKEDETNQLRKNVYDAIKYSAHGRNAAITTDPSLIHKMKEIGIRLQPGRHEMKGKIFNEIGVLISKVHPVEGQAKNTTREKLHQNDMNQKGTDIYE